MLVWPLGPDRAAEWRDIRLMALRDAPDAFDATLADWQHRPLVDFAQRLADVPTFAAGDRVGAPLAVASWLAGLDPQHPRHGWLLAVFAHPQARGRGYADAAIRASMADAARAGADSMGLNVRATNIPAQRLYRRLGFRAVEGLRLTNAHGLPEIQMILSPLLPPQ